MVRRSLCVSPLRYPHPPPLIYRTVTARMQTMTVTVRVTAVTVIVNVMEVVVAVAGGAAMMVTVGLVRPLQQLPLMGMQLRV